MEVNRGQPCGWASVSRPRPGGRRQSRKGRCAFPGGSCGITTSTPAPLPPCGTTPTIWPGPSRRADGVGTVRRSLGKQRAKRFAGHTADSQVDEPLWVGWRRGGSVFQPRLGWSVGQRRALLRRCAPPGADYGRPMAPQTVAALGKRTKTDPAPGGDPESTPDPDGDLKADRFTRHESSEAFVASLEERS